jgi:nickel/cobalt exporter
MMTKSLRLAIVLVASTAVLFCHPMGNFSVSHYSKLVVTSKGVDIRYVLDLAELPSLDLLRQWGLERTSPMEALQRKAAGQAREWSAGLKLAANGQPLHLIFRGADLAMSDGAGGLPIIRITSRLYADAAPGALTYADLNFEGRAGWKEIVIEHGPGASLLEASQGSQDRSRALTEYPQDPTVAPPQDVRASLEWSAERPAPAATRLPAPTVGKAPVMRPIPQPASPIAAPVTRTAQAAPAGTVTRGDYLSRSLRQREISFTMVLLAIVVAFGFGAAHALTPGHGKTIVAAYLVGSRGTLKHAAYLGAMVTFTHTISVFLLGLATLFLFRYVMPEKIVQVLGAISGLSIVALGAWMMYKRLRGMSHAHHHHHDQEHHHHDHEHGHPHQHSHEPGDHVHSHAPQELSWGALTALAVSGGLVPCESALVLLLSAIAIGRVGLGLILMIAFSLGLAGVLMGIGMMVLYAKHLLPQRAKPSRAVAWIPVVSAGVVVCLGLVMTGVSLGWWKPGWIG